MVRLNQKLIITVFSALAVIYLLLAVVGGIRNYSPVPYWDMWDGYINFFINVSSGNLRSWYTQHNEHRIVLSRALFWLDLTFFKERGVFLIIVNYLLVGLSWFVLSTTLKENLHKKDQPVARGVIQLVLLCLLFSWIQQQNLDWAFQSQFFLAQLLPLVTFYLMHRAYISKGYPNLLFSLACLTGIASLGTMANGVLILPLMTVLALLLCLSWQRILLLLTLSILSLYIYFQDYTACAQHGSLKDAVLHHPIELLQYVLIYLGGPFYYVGTKLIAQLAGVVLIGCSLKMAYKSLKQATPASLPLALLTFILYIALTAVGTAGGRLIFGLETAASSRYMTPALLAWSALLILYAPAIAGRLSTHPKRYLTALILIPILLLPQQMKASHSPTDELFERQISGLALALNINDQQQIGRIYPHINHVLSIAKMAIDKKLSIFGEPPLKNIHELIGQTELTGPFVEYQGNVDGYAHIEGDPRYVKIHGWLFEPNSKKAPQAIAILNAQNIVVGYALSGQLRPDVAHHLGCRQAKRSGFKGYLRADSLDQPLRLQGKQPACQLSVPPLPKHTSEVTQ